MYHNTDPALGINLAKVGAESLLEKGLDRHILKLFR